MDGWMVYVCVCVCVCVCVRAFVCVCVRRHQDGNAEPTRWLEKTTISGGFTRKWRIVCRWKELCRYKAHVVPTIQFPIGGRCRFCRGSDPSTIRPAFFCLVGPLIVRTTLPPHPLGSLELAVGPLHLTTSSGYGDWSIWGASTACSMAMAPSCHSPQGCRA